MTFCYLLLLTVGFISCVYFSNPTFLITWLITLRFVTRLVFLNDLLNWLIYVIILLFTGGIIVLFAYMTSLVTRYKINFPPISKFVIVLSLPLISLLNCQNYSLRQPRLFQGFTLNLEIYLFFLLPYTYWWC